jgi:alpha-beta hydrolase superfamily lysophospholipase
MRSDTFTFQADDGKDLFVYRFLPDPGPPSSIVHIAHGMAEHAGRYARLAEALTAAGHAVYANDHRGHGRTAQGPDELGFFASQGGFQRVVRDLDLLIAHEKQQHPGLPVTLLGHSMGSFLTQAFLLQQGHALKAAALSGSAGKPDLLSQAGRLVARLERLRLGERGRSKLLTSLSFDAFNKKFAPNRTGFDWLSRDPAEVDKYVADSLCGFAVTTTMWIDVLDGTAHIADPARQRQIPPDLPIYIFSGARDPVGQETKSVGQLVAAYQAAGLRRVTHRFYPEARHETLNEINRDEVTRDLVGWLDGALRG